MADKLGQQVGSKALQIVDDPFVEEGLGSSTYDGEGMSRVKRPLFEQGVLRTFFLDTYYASKLEREPTTAGSSNWRVPASASISASIPSGTMN